MCGAEFPDDTERCPEDASLLEDAAPYAGRTVGSYELTRCLGRGGMGAVYEGVHKTMGSKVAVKFLHQRFSADRGIVDRFFNEARAVNLIGHDNIVHVSDFAWLEDGSPYFVMEFLEGRPLTALCGAPQPLEVVGPVVLQMADALQAAHEAGIIHRDLKPDNVFLCVRNRRTDVVKIVDFGIAKLQQDPVAQGRTQTGAVMGTGPYMSPEQAGGDTRGVGPASDVYSMGVILFLLATGRLPFEGGFGEVLVGHLTRPPPAPRSLVPEIPEVWERIILRCLAKKPEDRFTSMQELYDVAGALLDSMSLPREPPMAKSVSSPGGVRAISRPPVREPSRPPPRGGATAVVPRRAADPDTPGGTAVIPSRPPPPAPSMPPEGPGGTAVVRSQPPAAATTDAPGGTAIIPSKPPPARNPQEIQGDGTLALKTPAGGETGGTVQLPPPYVPRRKSAAGRAVGIAAGLAALAAAGAAAFHLLARGERPVKVVLTSDPAGARVRVTQGTVSLDGSTPATFELKGGTAAHAIVEGPELVAQERDFTPEKDERLTFALEKRPKPVLVPPPPVPAAAPPTAPAPTSPSDPSTVPASTAPAPPPARPAVAPAPAPVPRGTVHAPPSKRPQNPKSVGDGVLDVDL